MMRTRFTDEQIIGILAEHEAGAKCADVMETLEMIPRQWKVIHPQTTKGDQGADHPETPLAAWADRSIA